MHACMAAVPMVEPMPLFPSIENTAPLSMVMGGLGGGGGAPPLDAGHITAQAGHAVGADAPHVAEQQVLQQRLGVLVGHTCLLRHLNAELPQGFDCVFHGKDLFLHMFLLRRNGRPAALHLAPARP